MKVKNEKWLYLQSGKDRNGDGVRREEGDEAKHSVNTALHLRSFNYLQFLNTLRYHHFYNPKMVFTQVSKIRLILFAFLHYWTFAFETYIAKALESEIHYLSNSISRFQTSSSLKGKSGYSDKTSQFSPVFNQFQFLRSSKSEFVCPRKYGCQQVGNTNCVAEKSICLC